MSLTLADFEDAAKTGRRIFLGDTEVPFRCTKQQFAMYETAKVSGYLVVDGDRHSKRNKPLNNLYWEWARLTDSPTVIFSTTSTRVKLSIDMIYSGRRVNPEFSHNYFLAQRAGGAVREFCCFGPEIVSVNLPKEHLDSLIVLTEELLENGLESRTVDWSDDWSQRLQEWSMPLSKLASALETEDRPAVLQWEVRWGVRGRKSGQDSLHAAWVEADSDERGAGRVLAPFAEKKGQIVTSKEVKRVLDRLGGIPTFRQVLAAWWPDAP